MKANPERPRVAPHPSAGPTAPAAIRTTSSAALLGGARELRIDHRGELYRLRLTALDKLILTK